MRAPDTHNPAEGYVRPVDSVQRLPRVVRHITGHNPEGKSVFLSTDSGNHHRELFDKTAIANIIYSTNQHPVELKNGVDIKYTHENEPGTTVKNGSVCRVVDFAPGAASPMHCDNSLDYAIVLEGVLRLILDSGEDRIMQRGDIVVQRSTAHRWVNVTGNGLLPARMLFLQLDTSDAHTGGEKVKKEPGLSSHEVKEIPHRGRVVVNVYDDDFFESEF